MRAMSIAATFAISALTLAGCSAAPSAIPASSEGSSLLELSNPEATSPEAIETETSPSETIQASPEASSNTSEDAQLEANGDQTAAVGTMTDVEILMEALMGPDGEYAAAASYQAVLDEYGQVEPYASILEAELRHISALTRQLERLGVDVPENPYLGQLSAPADLQTAAEAWAEGEVLNVELYDYLIAQTDDAQILKVLGNLRRASLESHLPTFELAAANGGTLDEMPTDSHSN